MTKEELAENKRDENKAEVEVIRYCGLCELNVSKRHWKQCNRLATVCPRNWSHLAERIYPVLPAL